MILNCGLNLHKLCSVLSVVLVPALVLFSSVSRAAGRQADIYRIIGKDSVGKSVLETRDGFVVAGGASDEAGRCCLGWVVKVDKNGNKLWEKTLGKNHNDYNFIKAAVVGNKVVVAGATDISYKPEWQGGIFAQASGWAVKLDENGAVEWDKKLKLTEAVKYKNIDVVVTPSVVVNDVKGARRDRIR